MPDFIYSPFQLLGLHVGKPLSKGLYFLNIVRVMSIISGDRVGQALKASTVVENGVRLYIFQ